jgi:hypothetical protein
LLCLSDCGTAHRYGTTFFDLAFLKASPYLLDKLLAYNDDSVPCCLALLTVDGDRKASGWFFPPCPKPGIMAQSSG